MLAMSPFAVDEVSWASVERRVAAFGAVE